MKTFYFACVLLSVLFLGVAIGAIMRDHQIKEHAVFSFTERPQIAVTYPSDKLDRIIELLENLEPEIRLEVKRVSGPKGYNIDINKDFKCDTCLDKGCIGVSCPENKPGCLVFHTEPCPDCSPKQGCIIKPDVLKYDGPSWDTTSEGRTIE